LALPLKLLKKERRVDDKTNKDESRPGQKSAVERFFEKNYAKRRF
jgi:hypothetical protein